MTCIEHHNMVREFQEKFIQPLDMDFNEWSKDRQSLRVEMLNEEIKEYEDAKTPAEKLDAIVDMAYLLHGAVAEVNFNTPEAIFGMHPWINQFNLIDQLCSASQVTPELYDEAFREVHKSNMSKLDENGEPIINGVTVDRVEGKPHGKVMKSELFKEPDLQSIIDKHSSQTEGSNVVELGKHAGTK